jgi:dTDP-4-dehydrorhamnose reductase
MNDSNSRKSDRNPSLVVGADGKIGGHLLQALIKSGQNVLATTRRREKTSDGDHLYLNLDDETSWRNLPVTSTAWLCAGVSSIERCEQEPGPSAELNVTKLGKLAGFLTRQGTRLVLISSNRVFDGSSAQVSEQATTCPVTEYGRQKAAIENRILKLPDSAVLRVSKVLFPEDGLMSGWMTDLTAGREIRAATDMYISPVSADLLVEALVSLGHEGACGVYQLSATEDVSYYDVACHLAGLCGADVALVGPISRDELADQGATELGPETFAPRHTTLDSLRLKEEFGISTCDPYETLQAVLKTGSGGRN